MKVSQSASEGNYPIDPNNYNAPAVKNNLRHTLHAVTHALDNLIQNPDQINEQNLRDLSESIKELKKNSDMALQAPGNTPLGEKLQDSATIINNALEAPIDA